VEFEAAIYTVLAEQKLWDQAPILEAIRGQRFGLVVLRESLDDPPPAPEMEQVTPAVRAALKEGYAAAGQGVGHWWYRPRPR
jgi:hypothetical protein